MADRINPEWIKQVEAKTKRKPKKHKRFSSQPKDGVKQLFSKYLPINSRRESYAVSLERDAGSKRHHLVLSHTRFAHDEHETVHVDIPARHLSNVIDMMQEALAALREKPAKQPEAKPEPVASEPADDVVEYADEYARVGAKWDREEEEWLLDEFCSYQNIAKLSKLLLRKPGGVRSRLKKLGVSDAPDPVAKAREILKSWQSQ